MIDRLKWKARVDYVSSRVYRQASLSLSSITLEFILTRVFLEIISSFYLLSLPPFFLCPADPSSVIDDELNAAGTSTSGPLICRVSISQLLALH